MIKNERQYSITKSEVQKIIENLDDSSLDELDIHPKFKEAHFASLKSELDKLNKQIHEYEELRNSSIENLFIPSFEGLPLGLIKARIILGLSQKDLAERLQMKEQQIQRYEANEYASASFSRLKEIVNSLGLKIEERIELNSDNLSTRLYFNNLSRRGIDKDLLLEKILPRKLSLALKESIETKRENFDNLLLQANAVIERVLNIKVSQFLTNDIEIGSGQHSLSFGSLVKFKKLKNSSDDRISLYTLYVQKLALTFLDGCKEHAYISDNLPESPEELEELIKQKYGRMDFVSALNCIWDLGIPVLPLDDNGRFHGACWRFDGQSVIVLKQNTKSSDRLLFDLIHEYCHVTQYPEDAQYTIIESEKSDKEQVEDEDEIEANHFAGMTILGENAHIMASECIKLAGRTIPRLKQSVIQTAQKYNVSQGALANYIAFRIQEEQDENWWSTANNLQSTDGDASYEIARKMALEKINFKHLNEYDRQLMVRVLK
jgi:Zn-dependent peptidase ImmA (M78 family)/transcriptional regulator with XRE-family HTH domain